MTVLTKRKQSIFQHAFGPSQYLTYLNNFANADWWHMQVKAGSVMPATNSALALGRELVREGAFPSDPGVWAFDTNWTIGGGKAIYDDAGPGQILQTLPIQPSQIYRIAFTISDLSSGLADLSFTDGSASKILVATDSYANGNHVVFSDAAPAGFDTKFAILSFTTSGSSWAITNISIKQTDIAASSDFPGAQLLDESGASGTATAANWDIASGATKENPEQGVLRVGLIGADNTAWVEQDALTIGKRNLTGLQVRSNGLATPRVWENNAVTLLFTGTASTEWQDVNLEFVATGTDIDIGLTDVGVIDSYVEFRNISTREANPMNGDLTSITVGIAGSRNVEFVMSSNGATSVGKFTTIAEVNSKIDFANGGMMIIGQSDTWAAGIDVLWRLAVDNDNEVIFERDGTDLICRYKQGGVSSTITVPSGSPAGLWTLSMDWDVDGAGLRGFYQGIQSGSAQTIAAAIIGNLNKTKCNFFADTSTPTNVWAGDLAHAGLFYRTPTAAEHKNYNSGSGL